LSSGTTKNKRTKNKGRNYRFPSLDGLVGGLVDRFVDRAELLTVCGEFAVAF
jgi:hypothetical protein